MARKNIFMYSALIMTRVKVFISVILTVLSCGLAFSQSAEADSYVTEEKAIQEACPQRVAFGYNIPAGHRYADMRADNTRMTRCASVAEGKAVVAEEKALHEACPARVAFGYNIPVGHRYADMRADSTRMTRCTSVAEGKAVVAEEKALHEACPARVAFGYNIPAGHRYADMRADSTRMTRCTSVAEGKAVVAEEKALHEACPARVAFGYNIPAGHRYADMHPGSTRMTRCTSAAEGEVVNSYALPGNTAGTMPSMAIGGVTTPATLPSTTANPVKVIGDKVGQGIREMNNKRVPDSGMRRTVIEKLARVEKAVTAREHLKSEDIKKVKEAIPYVVLSKAIYEHKVENDSKRGLKVENWERIQSTRASFKEAYNEASTTVLVNKLNRDGSLSAEDIRQIQRNDDKLDSDIMTIFAPKDPISFHAEVYKNGDGKRVIVFEGTGSLEDWIADFSHVSKVPDQYKKALEFTKKIIENCGNTSGCSKNDIAVTGHSLGGGLAQYIAMSVEADVKAYTFNPAGLWDSTAVSIDTGKAANITNFIADGYLYSDVVSKTGVVFGKKIPVAVSAILVHSIDGLKDAMVAQR